MKKILKFVWLVVLILFFSYINYSWDIEEKEKNNVINVEKKSVEESASLKNEIEKKDFCQQFIDAGKYYKVWSDTVPKINKTHIFCWEYNSKWKPTWFHSMPNWIAPKTIEIYELEKKNKYWVYNAKIWVYDIKNDKFRNKFSSIFPDNLSKDEVENAILTAWENKYYYKNSQFKWKSGLWFEIWWYTYKWKDKINTAYPIYKK